MNRKYLTVPALTSAIAVSWLALPTLAQSAAAPDKPGATATTADKSDSAAQAAMRFSKDGNSAIRDIAAARVAIFNGDPNGAINLVGRAKILVGKAEEEAPTFTVKTSESVAGKYLGASTETATAKWVPIDGELVLADDFVATPEKAAHIKTANEHFKSGKSKEALEELRLGEIAVSYRRVWMPLAPTYKHIEQATKLLGEHKYYEANLALKAVDDNLTVDSVSLIELPKKQS